MEQKQGPTLEVAANGKRWVTNLPVVWTIRLDGYLGVAINTKSAPSFQPGIRDYQGGGQMASASVAQRKRGTVRFCFKPLE
jgi:hypothetical protein